jgi:hypothetical protein
MIDDVKLDKYTVYIKLTVWGESPADAADYVNTALDASDLLDQDGIIGIDLIDDTDNIELVENFDEETDDGEL